MRFVYDGYQQIEQLDALNSNAVAKKRIHGFGGKLLCDIHGSTPYYALGDANKNITEYLDSTGTIQEHTEYSPFGKITKQAGVMAGQFDYGFSSEYYDTETNTVYYNFRDYDVDLGRWHSKDPGQERIGGPNLYWMCANNPIKWWDRLGLGWSHSITPFSANYDGDDYTAYFYVDIYFTSDDPCCLEWKLIQFANFQIGDLTVSPNPEDNDNLTPYPWTGWQGDNITEDGWFLDNEGGDSPYYDDNGPGRPGRPWSWSLFFWPRSAHLFDTPGWPGWPFLGWFNFDFEDYPEENDTRGKYIKMMFDIYAICTKCKCPEDEAG